MTGDPDRAPLRCTLPTAFYHAAPEAAAGIAAALYAREESGPRPARRRVAPGVPGRDAPRCAGARAPSAGPGRRAGARLGPHPRDLAHPRRLRLLRPARRTGARGEPARRPSRTWPRAAMAPRAAARARLGALRPERALGRGARRGSRPPSAPSSRAARCASSTTRRCAAASCWRRATTRGRSRATRSSRARDFFVALDYRSSARASSIPARFAADSARRLRRPAPRAARRRAQRRGLRRARPRRRRRSRARRRRAWSDGGRASSRACASSSSAPARRARWRRACSSSRARR